MTTSSLLRQARNRTDRMFHQLRELVERESPSVDPTALARCAELIDTQWTQTTGHGVTAVQVADRHHLVWSGSGEPRVLLLGHYDTVWPLGTIEELPFTVKDGAITGPGVLDMKAGIVQMLTAVALLGENARHVVVLLTADEEIGSHTSQDLIQDLARQAGAVLVCEPATPDGAIKTARRGVAHYRVTATGRAAHAGEEPERGINAAVEIALQTPGIVALASTEHDTTVTPTVMRAGTTTNSVPDTGHLDVDVRAWTRAELLRVDTEIRKIRPQAGCDIVVAGQADRPPFEPDLSPPLVAAVIDGANAIGVPVPPTVRWRSASDANITAGAGVRTLDGLGAVGAHPHARDEYVIAASVPDRAALLAATISRLIS